MDVRGRIVAKTARQLFGRSFCDESHQRKNRWYSRVRKTASPKSILRRIASLCRSADNSPRRNQKARQTDGQLFARHHDRLLDIGAVDQGSIPGIKISDCQNAVQLEKLAVPLAYPTIRKRDIGLRVAANHRRQLSQMNLPLGDPIPTAAMSFARSAMCEGFTEQASPPTTSI